MQYCVICYFNYVTDGIIISLILLQEKVDHTHSDHHVAFINFLESQIQKELVMEKTMFFVSKKNEKFKTKTTLIGLVFSVLQTFTHKYLHHKVCCGVVYGIKVIILNSVFIKILSKSPKYFFLCTAVFTCSENIQSSILLFLPEQIFR